MPDLHDPESFPVDEPARPESGEAAETVVPEGAEENDVSDESVDAIDDDDDDDDEDEDDQDDNVDDESESTAEPEPELEPTPAPSLPDPRLASLQVPYDPRLATLEDTTPDPRSASAPFGGPPTLASIAKRLQTELVKVTTVRDELLVQTRDLRSQLDQGTMVGERLAASLADEMAQHAKASEALQAAQSALLEASLRASALAAERDSLQAAEAQLKQERDALTQDCAALNREREALNHRFVFQVIPAHREGQKRDTRLYVLAADVPDAIERLERAGALQRAEIDNVTRTGQKLILG